MTEETDPHAVLGVASDADARAVDEAYAARAADAPPFERAALDAAYAAVLATRRRAQAVEWSLRAAAAAEPSMAPHPQEPEVEPEPEAAVEPEPPALVPAAQEDVEEAVIEEDAEPQAAALASLPDVAAESFFAGEASEPEPGPSPPPPSPPALAFRPDAPGRPLPEERARPAMGSGIVRTLVILLGGGLVMLLAGMALASLIGGHHGVQPAKAAGKTAPGVAPPPGARPLAAGRMVSWEEKDGPQTFAGEGLVLEVRAAGAKGERHAVVKVTGPGGAVAEIPGQVGFDQAAGSFGVGRLNGESSVAHVLVRSYTGGAHCCTATSAAQLYATGWKVFDLGQRDGDDLESFPKDLDGDGVADFVTVDNRFLYAFDSYAGSWPPPMVMNLAAGAWKDVSADPRFAGVFRDDLAKAGAACDGGSNGACAGYVAIAARLGQAPAAWKRMLARYQRRIDGELPLGCRRKLPDATAKCPPGDVLTFATFPEGLRWFLGDAGYMPPAWIPPRPGAAGPSFDCRKAVSAAQKAVCADPALAARDRELTLQYNRALLLVADVDSVRNAERAFLAELAGQSDPGAIAAMYDRRIGELRGQIAG